MKSVLRYNTEPFASEGLTVADTVVALTEATYAPAGAPAALRAFITVESQSARWWASGATPSASSGHLAAAGVEIELEGANAIRQFRTIRATGSSGAIMVSYER